jgi:hypothetical protein
MRISESVATLFVERSSRPEFESGASPDFEASASAGPEDAGPDQALSRSSSEVVPSTEGIAMSERTGTRRSM